MICNSCHNVIPDDAAYCPYCRASVSKDKASMEKVFRNLTVQLQRMRSEDRDTFIMFAERLYKDFNNRTDYRTSLKLFLDYVVTMEAVYGVRMLSPLSGDKNYAAMLIAKYIILAKRTAEQRKMELARPQTKTFGSLDEANAFLSEEYINITNIRYDLNKRLDVCGVEIVYNMEAARKYAIDSEKASRSGINYSASGGGPLKSWSAAHPGKTAVHQQHVQSSKTRTYSNSISVMLIANAMHMYMERDYYLTLYVCG